ncbi:MAG TPA: hypothetical protein VF331_27830 [Polyangiales bacterium]
MPDRHTLFFLHGMGDTHPIDGFSTLWSAIGEAYDHKGDNAVGDFEQRYRRGFIDWHKVTEAAKLTVFDDAFSPMQPQHTLPGELLHPVAAARTFMTYFLGDVTAYVSENDNNIRVSVWTEMQKSLELGGPYSLVAHSLGSVIAFDFVFNLFVKQQLFAPVNTRFGNVDVADLRRRFRGLYTMGAPIGLFMLRKGELWKPGDPSRNGGPAFSTIKNPLSSPDHSWLNFWDKQDVIAYPLEGLFATNAAYNAGRPLQDSEVSTGLEPISAHLGYWKCADVAAEIAHDLA